MELSCFRRCTNSMVGVCASLPVSSSACRGSDCAAVSVESTAGLGAWFLRVSSPAQNIRGCVIGVEREKARGRMLHTVHDD